MKKKTKCPEMLTALVQVTQLPSLSSMHSFKASLLSVYYILRHYVMYQGYEAMTIYSHCPCGTYSLVGKTNIKHLLL